MKSALRRLAVATAVLAGVLGPASAASAANPGSGTTGTGQSLNIQIDSPADGSSVAVPPGTVTVSGRTSIGALASANNAYYVLDVSGSTGGFAGDCNGDGVVDAGDNFNGDFSNGDILDCEIAGVLALNSSLGAAGIDVGLGAFSSGTFANGDVDPAADVQLFTTPVNADKNGNSTPDINEVARSVVRYQIGAFTARPAGSGGTDFNAAINVANTAFATQPATEGRTAFLLTDGVGSLSTTAGSPLANAVAAGTKINTYGVGSGAGSCNVGANIRTIADQTGGTCTVVNDPTDLSAALGGITPAGIDRVELTLNGGAPVTASLDALGNWSAPLSGVQVGPNPVVATVFADDGTQVSADITVIGDDGGTPVDVTAPVCELVSATSTGITVRAVDPDSGLATIDVTRAKNANVNVPTFTAGTNDEQIVTATKIKAGSSSNVQLRVTDEAGNSTVCDPVIAKLTAGEARTFHGVPDAEHYLTVSEAAGVAGVAVEVNGTSQIIWSPDGTTVDLGDMGDGTVTLRVLATEGTTAQIMLWDGKG